MKPLKSLGSFWQEFKAFAFKGNMIDLAVAVVIGAAFSGVINSLVKDIIMPSVIYVTSTGKMAAEKAAQVAKEGAAAVGVTTKPAETQPAGTQSNGVSPPAASAAPPAAAAPAPAAAPASKPDETKPVQLNWEIGGIKIGNFIAELLNFILIALAVFVTIVKLLGSVMKRVGGTPAPSEPMTKECPFCLSVIPVKARKCAHCTADLPATPAVGTQA
jgi:large conductance mechanosensitive channel